MHSPCSAIYFTPQRIQLILTSQTTRLIHAPQPIRLIGSHSLSSFSAFGTPLDPVGSGRLLTGRYCCHLEAATEVRDTEGIVCWLLQVPRGGHVSCLPSMKILDVLAASVEGLPLLCVSPNSPTHPKSSSPTSHTKDIAYSFENRQVCRMYQFAISCF